ncbi:DUF4913 domain-containing protein [Rhodococcus artemisiae]|uniref:DUF4913 domain-containing protein n=1 Tax=Rhodococcus artemisiae TaxID=714159 RepID=A0ABU7LJR9_9NOCA|nr:DUF4913 domain-containing protein [Rhodococcus artemisiae]MEE2061809.1 DUF4913 domain-containing protein [Rhodococcus artemisiae]
MIDDLLDDEFALDDDFDEDPQIDPAFESVEQWVSEYLAAVINRKIDPQAGRGLAWDPGWWRHSEVVARLTALWWAFEGARLRSREDRSAMSGWWVEHCEPHLRVLLDGETGPMSGANEGGTWLGHGSLAYEPTPGTWHADDLADLPEPAGENADELPEPAFSRLEDFVESYFCVVINRKIDLQPGHGLSWDPCWWRHQEVVSRLTSLWWAFEDARAASDDPAAMSTWWIRHCDPHLRVLLDGEDGPMSLTNGAGTWLGHGGLGADPPPEGWVRPAHLTP